MNVSLSQYTNVGTVKGPAAQANTLIGTNAAMSWAITGHDSGTVNGEVSFVAFGNLIGGTGGDKFTFGTGGSLSGTLDSGAGSDTLVAAIGGDTFAITGADTGAVVGRLGIYLNVENLMGAAGSDTFAFQGGSVSGSIDGALGTDTLDYSAAAGPVSVSLQTTKATSVTGTFSNVESFVGSSGSDTLTGANTANLWVVNATNQGTVSNIAFRSFENLAGGSGVDNFALDSNVAGSVSGNGGNDTFSATAPAISGTLDGGAGTDTLLGPNAVSNWRITGTAATGTGLLNSTAFSAIENLTGGNLHDDFNFVNDAAALGGRIDGGGGVNDVGYSGYSTPVAVNLGKAQLQQPARLASSTLQSRLAGGVRATR